MESEGFFVDEEDRAGQRESEREQVWLSLLSRRDLFSGFFKRIRPHFLLESSLFKRHKFILPYVCRNL